MLTIITEKGVYNTTESIESIKEKIDNAINSEQEEISFEGIVKEIPDFQGKRVSCKEIITIHLYCTPIIAFKEYTEIEEIHQMDAGQEIQKLSEEIEEKLERKTSLEEAIKDEDYQNYVKYAELAKQHREKHIAKMK